MRVHNSRSLKSNNLLTAALVGCSLPIERTPGTFTPPAGCVKGARQGPARRRFEWNGTLPPSCRRSHRGMTTRTTARIGTESDCTHYEAELQVEQELCAKSSRCPQHEGVGGSIRGNLGRSAQRGDLDSDFGSENCWKNCHMSSLASTVVTNLPVPSPDVISAPPGQVCPPSMSS